MSGEQERPYPGAYEEWHKKNGYQPVKYIPSQSEDKNLLVIQRLINGSGADEIEIAAKFFPLWVKYYEAFREYARINGFIEYKADKE